MSDTRNFEAFMTAYQDMVYSTAMRLLGNSAEAQDVSQEVFLKAYDRFEDLRDSPTAGGWLKTVARNMCLNHLSRYRKRWTFFSDLRRDDDERGDRELDFAAPEPDADELELADQRQLLESALRKLPEAQRVPLVLYHFENMRYEEIARQLKRSLSKVKTDIHRGRLALRQKLRRDGEGELTGMVGMISADATY